MKNFVFAVTLIGFAYLIPDAHCQWKQLPSTGSSVERLPDRTTLSGQSGVGPLLVAKLMDEEKNAKEHKAVVEVQTDGVQLVDPGADKQPKLDEAHVQYKLDAGPVQDSKSTTWTFDNLAPGKHIIHVSLAANDDHPIGKGTTLKVDVP